MLDRVITHQIEENDVIRTASASTAVAAMALAAALLAGCGAGGYGAASSMYPGPGPSQPPVAQSVPLATMTLNGAPGFVNSGRFTVYVFDADLQTPGASACNGSCAQNWPPLVAPSGTIPSPYGSIVRQDGRTQLTYKTRPLYTFTGDGQPGATNGDGLDAFGGIWHIARP